MTTTRMTATREQIIEGRDEALEHLGIAVAAWERTTHDQRMGRMKVEATRSPLAKAAALTVAEAERALCDGFEAITWVGVAISIRWTSPLRASDVGLVA